MLLTLDSAIVSSPCPLLSPERAEEFLPAACMVVPRNSAWISMQIDVSQFAAADGSIHRSSLRAALDRCVDDGERLHDETDWPEPLVEHDSWLNRRLAIAVRGWGDLVELRDVDPRAIDTLRRLEELARWICASLHERSRMLADGCNWCPALDEAGTRAVRNKAPKIWNRRWKKAIAEVAVRHRNLTTMSPWDVFPRGFPADLRFADLLPLTRFFDSLSFQCDTSISHWNANDFKGFHKRVAAIVRCNDGAGLVAKQV